MMTTTHPLATAWLDRVEALSTGLPEDRRQELLADLREHLEAALPPDPDAATVEQVLARMGDPADIVAAAHDDLPPPPPALAGATAVTSDRLTTAEVVTLVLFVLSGLLLVLWPLAIIAWVVAVVLLLTRDRWEGAENLVALLLPFGFSVPWVFIGVAGVAGGQSCTGSETFDGAGNLVSSTAEVCTGGAPTWVGIVITVVLVVLFLAAIWAVRWLVRRIHARHATS